MSINPKLFHSPMPLYETAYPKGGARGEPQSPPSLLSRISTTVKSVLGIQTDVPGPDLTTPLNRPDPAFRSIGTERESEKGPSL